MSCDIELFVGNDCPVTVMLVDDVGAPVSGASLAITELLDVLANAAVTGITPPISLPEITPLGTYRGSIPGTAALLALRKYKMTINGTLASGAPVRYVRETFAKEG